MDTPPARSDVPPVAEGAAVLDEEDAPTMSINVTQGDIRANIETCKLNAMGLEMLKAKKVTEFNNLRMERVGWIPDLSGADLSGAYLSGAYLSFTILLNTNLSGAYLACAIFARSNLSGADLSGAYLAGANLSGANLIGVKGLTPEGLAQTTFFRAAIDPALVEQALKVLRESMQ